MNPNGVVPTIDDSGRVIWESNTIARYLAAKYAAGSLWPNDPGERSEAERWMDWQLSTIHTGMRDIFWGLIRTPPEKRDMAAITKTADDTGKLWACLDEKLAGKLYVAGRHFTMGDIPAGCWVHVVCASHRAAQANERESLVRTAEDATSRRETRHGAADVALCGQRPQLRPSAVPGRAGRSDIRRSSRLPAKTPVGVQWTLASPSGSI